MAVKPREERTKVLVKARMRVIAEWLDVCISNISSRGMLLQSTRAPERGSYVELRRGRHVVIARVVWTSEDRFGIHAQDNLSVDAIVADPNASATDNLVEAIFVERRATPRRRTDPERSRTAGRAIEFACLAFLAAVSATTLYGAAYEALAKPLSAVSAQLGD
jgi:hypothetical protein